MPLQSSGATLEAELGLVGGCEDGSLDIRQDVDADAIVAGASGNVDDH